MRQDMANRAASTTCIFDGLLDRWCSVGVISGINPRQHKVMGLVFFWPFNLLTVDASDYYVRLSDSI